MVFNNSIANCSNTAYDNNIRHEHFEGGLKRMSRRALTSKELAWKENLAAIWAVKKKELKLTQEKLAERLGWKSQGSVGQYLTGRIPLNTDAKFAFAKALGVSVLDIDPELTESVDLSLNNPQTDEAQEISDAEADRIIEALGRELSAEQLSNAIAGLALFLKDKQKS